MYVQIVMYLGGELTKENQIISCNIDLTFLMTRPSVPGATIIEAQG